MAHVVALSVLQFCSAFDRLPLMACAISQSTSLSVCLDDLYDAINSEWCCYLRALVYLASQV